MKNNYLTGVLCCLLAVISWGAMYPIMSLALTIIDPFSFTLIRYSIAGIFFLLFGYFKEGKELFSVNGKHLLLWFVGSAGFAGFGFFVFLGQKMTGVEYSGRLCQHNFL
jgi:drug/metabolite transporter (DMT)-like permease